MRAVIAVRFCFCFAMGIGSTQLLFWKSSLNSRCPGVDGAEGLRQVMMGPWTRLLWSFRIWISICPAGYKSRTYSRWKIINTNHQKEDKKWSITPPPGEKPHHIWGVSLQLPITQAPRRNHVNVLVNSFQVNKQYLFPRGYCARKVHIPTQNPTK